MFTLKLRINVNITPVSGVKSKSNYTGKIGDTGNKGVCVFIQVTNSPYVNA